MIATRICPKDLLATRTLNKTWSRISNTLFYSRLARLQRATVSLLSAAWRDQITSIESIEWLVPSGH